MVVGASPKTAMDAVRGVDLSGKTAVVTGGNSGIGLETVRALAYAGADVVFTCRNLDSGRQVLNSEFRSLSGHVSLVHLDLADLASVRSAADDLKKLEKIDFLILNAGVMAPPKSYTKHGFESQFGINVIGHYYLEQLLEEKLKSQDTPSRIIILSSVAHQFGWVDLKDLHYRHGRTYWAWPAYGQSKMSDLLWAKELSRKLSGTKITVVAIHPGNIFTNLQKYLYFGLFIFWILSLFKVTKSPQQGAATTVWATVTPDVEQHSGAYCEDCRISKPVAMGEDLKLAHDLCGVIDKQLDMALTKGKFVD